MSNLWRHLRTQRGQTLVEYAMILVLVAVVCMIAVANFGQETERIIPRLENAMADAREGGG